MPIGVYPRKPVAVNCVCAVCGTAFHTKPSRIRRDRGKFCSRACNDQARATGPNSRPAHWGRSGPPPHPRDERFYEKIVCDLATGCWIWIGGIGANGYGRFAYSASVYIPSHRFSWGLLIGEIPPDMFVLHRCDALRPIGDTFYRRCVRPDHLFLGTKADNTHDMMTKGRARFRGWPHILTEPVGPA